MELRQSGILLHRFESTEKEYTSTVIYNLGVRHLRKESLDVAYAFFCDALNYVYGKQKSGRDLNKTLIGDTTKQEILGRSYNNLAFINHLRGLDSLVKTNLEAALKKDPGLIEARENLELLTSKV